MVDATTGEEGSRNTTGSLATTVSVVAVAVATNTDIEVTDKSSTKAIAKIAMRLAYIKVSWI